MKINVFRTFFAFRLEMHVSCYNQYKTGADWGNILGQPMLFECMGICITSPAPESKMRGHLVNVLIVKYPTDFVQIQGKYVRLDGLIIEWWGGFLKKHFLRGLWTMSFIWIV